MTKDSKLSRIMDSASRNVSTHAAKGSRKKYVKRFWTDEENAKLIALYPHKPTVEVAAALGRRLSQVYQHADQLGLKKTAEYLASPAACRLRRGYHAGWEHRFKKGQTPLNKGLRRPGWAPGRMAETQFKKGERSGKAARNWKPVGTVLADSEGFLRRKTCEPTPEMRRTGFGNTQVWEYVHKRMWQDAHGQIPAAHVLRFKDGNRANCVLENLKLISFKENMALNTVHRLPKELAELIQLKGALNRQIRKREKHGKEHDGRPAESSIRDTRSA